MLASISEVENISRIEDEIERDCGIKVSTQHKYKADLRAMFEIKKYSGLAELASHPQIKPALEYIIARKRRTDSGNLRSGKNLIVMKAHGEYITLEEHLLAVYAWEKHNACSAYRSLIELCERGLLVFEQTLTKCTLQDVPAESTIVKWLKNNERGSLALRRSRMTTAQWEAKEMVYVSRNPAEYRPGGLLMGDHTEIDNIVYRLDGPVGTITTGHLWITAFIDYRTSMLKGWVISRQPNSQTIAQAFRNAVLGTQLKVATRDGYMSMNYCDAPEDVYVDRGQDYKSKYTKQVVGQIGFEDEAKMSVERISKLHYVTKHHPQSKAQMERFFGVIQNVTRYLPGYKGPKYQDKPDELNRQVKNFELMTEEEFIKAWEIAVNAYNNRARRDLNGMSPMEYTLNNQQYVRKVDERVLDFLMMKSTPRKIHRGYVTVDNVEYFSFDLQGYSGREAIVYREPQNIGRAIIYVGGNFITSAINKDMMGVSEADRLKWVKMRHEKEKVLRDEIKNLRQGMTSREVKELLFNGETKNIKKLEIELYKKQIEQRLVVTGLEGKAEEVSDEINISKELAEVNRKAKKHNKELVPITIDAIKNIQ